MHSNSSYLIPRLIPSSVRHLFLSFMKLPHIHTHRLPHSPWLECISWWPRQVTDGDLTALLTVNWVLIKPKHVWEMLIIHCRLRDAGVQPWEHWDYACAFASLVYNHFPHCVKTTGALLSIYGMRQNGLSVSTPTLKLYLSPKINIDENLTNSNLGVLTLWKLSGRISNCLSAYLPKDSHTIVPFLNIFISVF